MSQNFLAFKSEKDPVLEEFLTALGLPPQTKEIPSLLRHLDSVLKMELFEQDDFPWLVTRLGYFVGDFFVQKFGGKWFLNQIPETKFFLRYVVGDFNRITNRSALIDPHLIAYDFIRSSPPRDLVKLVEAVEGELISV